MNTDITTNPCENPEVACCECGCVGETLIEIDGKLYCEDCLRDTLGYEQCDDCGEWVPSDELTEVYEYPLYCHNTHYVCGSCLDDYYQCEDCQDYFEESCVSELHGGGYVCESCADDYYRCEDCGDLFRGDDGEWDDDEDCWLCYSCAGSRHATGKINSYGYKPDPIFFGLSRFGSPAYGDPLTFGLELEIDKGHRRDACAGDLGRTFEDRAYLKSDSSVDFEIVTHPCTLDFHRNDMGWKDICAVPPRYDYKSHDAGTCGLHIHVGLAQLGKDYEDRRVVLAKILLLLYRHWDCFVKFTRRTDSQLSHWAAAPQLEFSPDWVRYDADAMLRMFDEYRDQDDRYRALNLCNSNTVEFRLFRGTLKPDTLLAAVDLTSNLCLYAMNMDWDTVVHSSWLDVARYNEYPELDAYLAERELSTSQPMSARLIPWMNDTKSTGYTDGTHVLVNISYYGTVPGTIRGGIRLRRGAPIVDVCLSPDVASYFSLNAVIAVNVQDVKSSLTEAEYSAEVRKYHVDLPEVGSKVVITPNPEYPQLAGMIAYVRTSGGRLGGSNVKLGLYIPEHNGHDLGGILKGDERIHGWWIAAKYVKPFETDTSVSA